MAVRWGVKVHNGPKWVVRQPWAIGHTGNKRVFNIIDANVEALLCSVEDVFNLTCRLRDLFIAEDLNTDKEEGPKTFGQSMIIANSKAIWAVDVAFGIIGIRAGELWAEGSGRSYALGASVFRIPTDDPATVVEMAIRAAVNYDDVCGGDAWYKELKE